MQHIRNMSSRSRLIVFLSNCFFFLTLALCESNQDIKYFRSGRYCITFSMICFVIRVLHSLTVYWTYSPKLKRFDDDVHDVDDSLIATCTKECFRMSSQSWEFFSVIMFNAYRAKYILIKFSLNY